jgi:hypothetical protein
VPNDEETLAHPEQPRFLFAPWLWAVALFLSLGLIAFIAFGAMSRGSSYEEDRARARAEKLKTAQEEWSKAENGYGWVDQAKGVAHLPIDRAMALELEELKAKKVAAAGPIATPAAEAAPATPAGAAQPTAPPVTAPTTAPSPGEKLGESAGAPQPAAGVHPPNAPPNTQPGPNTTPAAKPNSLTEVPPVSPTETPMQHPPGTPIPLRTPAATPQPTAH